jgi:hypothetical protein
MKRKYDQEWGCIEKGVTEMEVQTSQLNIDDRGVAY